MAYPEGLLCASLELHRRSYAPAYRRSLARLSLVVEPLFVGSNPPILNINKCHPLKRWHLFMAYPEGFEPTTLSVGG